MNSRILKFAISALIVLTGTYSCYQDLNQDPEFDYPPVYIPQYSPLKVYLPFDGNDKNKSNYRFSMISVNESYVDGTIGKSFKGSDGAYLIAIPPVSLQDTIMQLGSFTYSVWINSPRNETVQGIMSIAKKDHTRGYVEVYFENNNNGNQAYVKAYLRTVPAGAAAKEAWVDVSGTTAQGSTKINDVWNKWTHLVFRYDGNTSTFSIFKDGVSALLDYKVGGGTFGKLNFDKTYCDGKIVFGTFAKIAGQSTGTQDTWITGSKTFLGLYDQVRFYNKALTNAEIQALYTNKE